MILKFKKFLAVALCVGIVSACADDRPSDSSEANLNQTVLSSFKSKISGLWQSTCADSQTKTWDFDTHNGLTHQTSKFPSPVCGSYAINNNFKYGAYQVKSLFNESSAIIYAEFKGAHFEGDWIRFMAEVSIGNKQLVLKLIDLVVWGKDQEKYLLPSELRAVSPLTLKRQRSF